MGARPALIAVLRRGGRLTRTPVFGLCVVTALVLVGTAGATPGFAGTTPPRRVTAVTPLAAVLPVHDPSSGPAVVAVERPPSPVHIAAAAPVAAPPPAPMVYAPGTLGIPVLALSAYRNAEQKMAAANPGCGVSWNLLAGIGRIESGHANGGATDVRGTALQPIYGPALDGSLPGNEIIVAATTGTQVVYARALGPMQFLPGTWARYASDGDGDGQADPQNLYDAALAAAQYLCAGGLDLRDQSQVLTSILRYNNSMPYARNVLGWAAAYATGVVPVDLPPLTGPAPPLGDLHLEHPEGLGPNLPLNVHGLSSADPLARAPLIDLSPPAPPQAWSWLPPWLQPAPPPTPACAVICLEPQGAPAAPMPPQELPLPAPAPPGVAPPEPPAPEPAAPAPNGETTPPPPGAAPGPPS